jgi:hypothetical protein
LARKWVATDVAALDAVDDGAAEELHPAVMIATAAGAASHTAPWLRKDCPLNTRPARRRRLHDLTDASRLFIETTSAVEHSKVRTPHPPSPSWPRGRARAERLNQRESHQSAHRCSHGQLLEK